MSAFTSLINGSVLGELTETKGLNEEWYTDSFRELKDHNQIPSL